MGKVKMRFEKEWIGATKETTFSVGVHEVPEESVDRWLKRGAVVVSEEKESKAVTSAQAPKDASEDFELKKSKSRR